MLTQLKPEADRFKGVLAHLIVVASGTASHDGFDLLEITLLMNADTVQTHPDKMMHGQAMVFNMLLPSTCARPNSQFNHLRLRAL